MLPSTISRELGITGKLSLADASQRVAAELASVDESLESLQQRRLLLEQLKAALSLPLEPVVEPSLPLEAVAAVGAQNGATQATATKSPALTTPKRGKQVPEALEPTVEPNLEGALPKRRSLTKEAKVVKQALEPVVQTAQTVFDAEQGLLEPFVGFQVRDAALAVLESDPEVAFSVKRLVETLYGTDFTEAAVSTAVRSLSKVMSVGVRQSRWNQVDRSPKPATYQMRAV